MVKNYRPVGVGMIPAERGTYLVHAYFDDNQVDLVRTTIVGWQISQERELTPLTIDPRAAAEDPWFVVHPDERVECSDGRCWADVDTWIAEERRMRRDALEAQILAQEKARKKSADDAAAPAAEPSPAPIPQAMPDPEREPEPEPAPEKDIPAYMQARRM